MIAPHGGVRRHGELPEVPRRGARQRRINDLHTAALAVELADRLGGSYVVNRGLDRNRLDLNRISQVQRRAPWFLQLVARLATAIADRHGEVQVLVVHGWNVGQGRCDVGVGADLSASSDTATRLSELTVSPEFLRRRLRPLTAGAGGDPAQRFTLGERYPARHRNNLLQLFRRDGSRSAELPDRLAALVRAGRCQAVQLELGAPLRWPGPRRDRFLTRLVEAFGDDATATATAPRQPTAASPPRAGRAAHRSHGATAQALQVFDPRSGVAVLASVDRLVEPGPVFGRVALFLPDGRVGLYTGESASAAGLVGDGPCFTARDGGHELSFSGAFLVTANGDDYVDLERALLFSDLVDAEIAVAYEPRAGGAFGTVAGVVRLGDTAYPIDATGFSKAREWGAWRRAARAHWSIRAAFTDGAAALYQSAASRSGATRVDCARLLLGDDPYAPEELTLAVAARSLQVRPLSRMSIARPVGPTRRARVTFGPAAIHEAGRTTGFAIYEYARLIDR